MTKKPVAGVVDTASSPLERLLACPVCASPLVRTDEGMQCSEHGLFPRSGRLISFIPGGASEFDRHWDLARAEQRPAAKVEAARRFLAPVRDLAGKRSHLLAVLDVGCGDGVHLQHLLEDGRFAVAGLDYSARALASAMQQSGEWLPVHGDAQHLPFAADSFDAVISFGVQAYLDDPKRGLAEIVRVAKPGALIGLWYAPPRRGVPGALFSLTRAVVPRLPGWAQVTLANLLVPFLGLMPTASTLSLRTGTWRECREVILVNIAPRHLVFPTRAEIESRLSALGCEIVARPDAIEGEYWARKGGA